LISLNLVKKSIHKWCNESLNKRITISIDEKIESKIRKIQASQIAKYNKAISFSTILCEIISEGLKEYEFSETVLEEF